jgi:putative serine protease PepD
MKVGDVVTKFNGVNITSASELTAAVRQEPAGAEAIAEVIRGGKTLTIKVTLGNASALK